MSFWRLSIDALVERKMRTALTILMVMIGASLLIAVHGMSAGTVDYMTGQFSELGANLLVLTPRSTDFTIDDRIVREIQQVEGVADVIPYMQQGAIMKSRGRSINTFLIGLDQSKLPLIFPGIEIKEGTEVTDNLGVLLGNELTGEDTNEGQMAFVGDSVKMSFGKTSEETGRVIEISRSYSVRGVLEYHGSNFIPIDQMAFITLQSANNFFERKWEYDGIYIQTEDPALNRGVRNQLNDQYNVNVINPQQISQMIGRVTEAIASFVNSIAVVSLFVAAIGIIAAQYTSLMERIKEIGTMKALGYTERQILVLFLNEAILIGMIGGTIGCLSGVFLGLLLNELMGGGDNFSPIFEPQVFVFTWVLCLLLAVLAGFYPAWRAAKLDPVDALRKE